MSWVVREQYHSSLSLQGLFANLYHSETEITNRRQPLKIKLEGVIRMSIFHTWNSIHLLFEVSRGRANLFDFGFYNDYPSCHSQSTFVSIVVLETLIASIITTIR
jgi:hypothetical protein